MQLDGYHRIEEAARGLSGRELKRHDKALVETAALLVLSQKLSAIYGEGADE